MRCRTFRKTHTAYVDGRLNETRSQAMRAHAQTCGPCGRLDVAIRRGLLVARNLPPVQPSANFMLRLEDRLRQEEVCAGGTLPLRSARTAAAVLAVAVAGTVLAATAIRGPTQTSRVRTGGNAPETPVTRRTIVVPATLNPVAAASQLTKLPAASSYRSHGDTTMVSLASGADLQVPNRSR
jgi:hypothetical protein